MTDPAMFKDLEDAKTTFVTAQRNYFLSRGGSPEKQKALKEMQTILQFVLDYHKESARTWILEIITRYSL